VYATIDIWTSPISLKFFFALDVNLEYHFVSAILNEIIVNTRRHSVGQTSANIGQRQTAAGQTSATLGRVLRRF
jgi:hypothetical protein